MSSEANGLRVLGFSRSYFLYLIFPDTQCKDWIQSTPIQHENVLAYRVLSCYYDQTEQFRCLQTVLHSSEKRKGANRKVNKEAPKVYGVLQHALQKEQLQYTIFVICRKHVFLAHIFVLYNCERLMKMFFICQWIHIFLCQAGFVHFYIFENVIYLRKLQI